MAGTQYRASIRDLGDAAAELHALLTVLVSNCDRVCADLDAGMVPLDSVRSVADEPAQAFRRDVHGATTRFGQAMQAARAASFSVLVRDGGIPVSDLSRMTGLSTQMIRRLLRAAEGA